VPDSQVTLTAPRPVAPSAPAPPPQRLTPAQRQALRRTQLLPQGNEKAVVGGAAKAAAMAGQAAKGQKGALRPSQQLRIWANLDAPPTHPPPSDAATPPPFGAPAGTVSYSAVERQHREAVFAWMNANLKDARLTMGKFSYGVTTTTTTFAPYLFLSADIVRLSVDLENALEKHGGVTALIKDYALPKGASFAMDLAKTIGSDEATVWGALGDLITNVPLLGSVVGALKVVGFSFFVALDTYRMVSARNRRETSCSAIEALALDAVVTCYSRELIDDVTSLVQASLSTASAATGGIAGVVGMSVSAVKLVVKTTLLVTRLIGSLKANQKIAAGQIDEALLADFPLLALALPHLPEVGVLEVLGVLPLGYDARHPGLARLRQKLMQPEGLQMLTALNEMDIYGTAPSALPALWRADFDRVLKLMEDTDHLLFDQPFSLVGEDGEPLYTAPPMTRWQEIKKWGKDKYNALTGERKKPARERGEADDYMVISPTEEAGEADTILRPPAPEEGEADDQPLAAIAYDPIADIDRIGTPRAMLMERTLTRFQDTPQRLGLPPVGRMRVERVGQVIHAYGLQTARPLPKPSPSTPPAPSRRDDGYSEQFYVRQTRAYLDAHAPLRVIDISEDEDV